MQGFIPLLYVAWADGFLSPSEATIIRQQIDQHLDLSAAEKEQLHQWCDPNDWPQQDVFKHWLALMKDASMGENQGALQSVTDLGVLMVKRSATGSEVDERMISALADTLHQLESEVGLPAPAKYRSLRRHLDDMPMPVHLQESRYLQQLMIGPNTALDREIKNLLTDPVFDRRLMTDRHQYRKQVLQWLKILADRGYGALAMPEAQGGGGDITKYATVFETLALFDISLAVKFGVQFGLFGGSIQSLGDREHHYQYLADAGQGSLLGCFAMTETGHGSNVRDLQTTATYDADAHQIVIHTPTDHDRKEYIGNALHASMATVFAQLIVQGQSQGVHAILVPLRDKAGQLMPGVRIEDNGQKLGLNGVDNGLIWFDQVRVPRENLLSRYGKITLLGRYESEIANPAKRFFLMLGTLSGGRICVGRGALAAAKSALAIAIRYGLRRRQFGPDREEEMLIMDYPTHQRRLMPLLASAYAHQFALNRLTMRYHQRSALDHRVIEAQAAALKARSTWFANATIQECREACGGKGYLWTNRFADLRADTDIFATFEGDNTVLMQLVARSLLSSFKDEFNSGGFLGVIRYLASQVGDSLLTVNPVYKRKTDADHLQDPSFHRHAFDFHERKLLQSLASRMRDMFRKRITPYDAFLRCQNHMIELAKAYSDGLLLNSFQTTLADCTPAVQPFLNILYQLYALKTLEDNRAWYLEQDYFEYAKTKAIRHQIDRLCEQVRQHAGLFVDGFGIPDHLLGADII